MLQPELEPGPWPDTVAGSGGSVPGSEPAHTWTTPATSASFHSPGPVPLTVGKAPSLAVAGAELASPVVAGARDFSAFRGFMAGIGRLDWLRGERLKARAPTTASVRPLGRSTGCTVAPSRARSSTLSPRPPAPPRAFPSWPATTSRSCVSAKVAYKVATNQSLRTIPHFPMYLCSYSSGLVVRISGWCPVAQPFA